MWVSLTVTRLPTEVSNTDKTAYYPQIKKLESDWDLQRKTTLHWMATHLAWVSRVDDTVCQLPTRNRVGLPVDSHVSCSTCGKPHAPRFPTRGFLRRLPTGKSGGLVHYP
ncbi:MAG: hypothetical protein J07HX5_01933 [halophilic archaeon J07HX5]|nr:MAG: hypothetical protein J07HX5_01933 [halophilic archaeon J07HX5]